MIRHISYLSFRSRRPFVISGGASGTGMLWSSKKSGQAKNPVNKRLTTSFV